MPKLLSNVRKDWISGPSFSAELATFAIRSQDSRYSDIVISSVAVMMTTTEPIPQCVVPNQSLSIQFLFHFHRNRTFCIGIAQLESYGFQFIQEIKKSVKSFSSATAVLFFDDTGKMAGYSQNARYFNDSSDYSFFDRLKTLNFDFGTKWLGLVSSNELIPFNKQSNYDVDNLMICGVNKHIYTLSSSPEPHSLYILFEINQASLLSCFSHLEYEGSSIFLLDENGKVLSGSLPTGEVPEFYDYIEERNSDSFIFTDSNHEDAQIIYYRINSIG